MAPRVSHLEATDLCFSTPVIISHWMRQQGMGKEEGVRCGDNIASSSFQGELALLSQGQISEKGVAVTC